MVLVVCADLSFKVVVLYRLVIFVLVWTPSPQRHLLDFSPLSFCLFCLLGGDLCVGFGVGSLRRHQAEYREAASEGGRGRAGPALGAASDACCCASPITSLTSLLPISYLSPTSFLHISYLSLTYLIPLSLSHLPLTSPLPHTSN